MRITRDKTDTNDDLLWHLTNNLGSKVSIAHNYVKDDEVMFTRWLDYQSLLHLEPEEWVPGTRETRQEFIESATHRTILDVEILLDIDEKGEFDSIKAKAEHICKQFDEWKLDYTVSWTGSKSYHISLIFPELRLMSKMQRERWKLTFLRKFGADLQKKSERTMIALEGARHYRSGKPKTEVNFNTIMHQTELVNTAEEEKK